MRLHRDARLRPAEPFVFDLSGDLLIEAGSLTELGEMVYTEGDCWALAWHFAFLLGHTEDLRTLGEAEVWSHVVVKVDDDLYLDGTGLWTQADLEAEWPGDLVDLPRLATESLTGYMRYLDQTSFHFPRHGGHREARSVARVLLARDELRFLQDESYSLELVG